MSFPKSFHWLALGLTLAVALAVAAAALGWTEVAAGLTALIIGMPLAFPTQKMRDAMESRGMSVSEFGPRWRPVVVAPARSLPDAVNAAQRAA